MTKTRIGGGYKEDWRSVGTAGVIKKVGRMVGKAMILKRWPANPTHDGKRKIEKSEKTEVSVNFFLYLCILNYNNTISYN